MALPLLRILDVVVGLADVARGLKQRSTATAALRDAGDRALARRAAGGPLEARLAGVMVAALKEAFDRDHQRLEFEREQREADEKRAARLLKMELARQTGDREIGRLRLLAGVTVASWLGTLLFAATVVQGGAGARGALAVGWLLLLAALATSLVAQSTIASTLAAIDETRGDPPMPSAGAAGAATPWLVLAGLAVIALAVLLR